MTLADDLGRRASISDVLRLLDDALAALGASHRLRDVETLGALVHEAMSLDSRHYHDVGHAVSVARGGDAIETLAGLLHDVVYHHVDHAFAPLLAPLVEPWVESQGTGLRLDAEACATDRWVRIVLEVFGISPGQTLDPAAGQNELLSALVAVKALEGLVSPADLVQVVACIEATIPFRRGGEGGRRVTERLGRRLRRANRTFSLGLGPARITRCLVRAVNVSNRDVASFGREDATEFLAETWLLFAESNPALARKRGFFIADYRRSLVGALGFFRHLDPASVFRAYDGVPAAPILEQWNARVRNNLAEGIVYLEMKLVGIALLEALARLTGGDTFMAMFMGQVRYDHDDEGERLEDYLPRPASRGRAGPGGASPIYRLLAEGRAVAGASRFDMPNSPVTAFMHDRLGPAGVLELYPAAAAMIAGDLHPEAFLARVREDVLHDMLGACKRIAWTRAEDLDRIPDRVRSRADVPGLLDDRGR